MKKTTLFIALCLFIFYSCSEKKTETNKNLIYFNSKFLAELGDDDRYDELEKEIFLYLIPLRSDN